jgi:8-oxo-dGTP pyrophosphatase MutT (NUDIX family)
MNITVEQRQATTKHPHLNASSNTAGWHSTGFLEIVFPRRNDELAQSTGSTADANSLLAGLRRFYDRLRQWRFLNRQRSAFAFIAVGRGAERRYLLQWNEVWCGFNLIGGKLDDSKGDAGSLSRALQRELEEELGLKYGEDFEVGPCLKTVKMRQFSRRENKSKNYRFGVFDVSLFPQLLKNINYPNYAARWLSTHYENVFVSAEEVVNLATSDGRSISRTTKRVLQALGEIP